MTVLSQNDILLKVESVVQNILQLPDLSLSLSMNARSIEDWDSLNHIQIVVALEKEFAVRFSASELVAYEDIGALVDAIQSKLAQKNS